MGKRNSQQRDKPPKKIITLSMQREDITLHHSENAWKPAAKAKDATDADTSKTQVRSLRIMMHVKCLLRFNVT